MWDALSFLLYSVHMIRVIRGSDTNLRLSPTHPGWLIGGLVVLYGVVGFSEGDGPLTERERENW
jgi:hypothetical protein